MRKFFFLSWKKLLIVFILEIASIVLHNLVSGILGVEEAFFFSLAIFLLPIYILIAVLYTLLGKLKKS